MDYRGYSRRIVEVNAEANKDSLGVRLGRYCISRDISVSEMASYFEVSKMTIYKWFTGKSEPRKLHQEKITKILTSGGDLV
jgi:transcriptional regulator with XRE-family HTH domain